MPGLVGWLASAVEREEERVGFIARYAAVVHDTTPAPVPAIVGDIRHRLRQAQPAVHRRRCPGVAAARPSPATPRRYLPLWQPLSA
jgi:hypothetical protein